MANWEYISVDTDSLQPGKFYRIYTNKDNATLTLLKDDEDAKFSQIETNKTNIEALQDADTNYQQLIYDNQARINNLEDRDLEEEFSFGLNLNTIKVTFSGATNIKINYARNEITNVQVWAYDETSIELHKKYTNIHVLYENHVIKDVNGNIVEKYILLKPAEPITGYAVIL